MSDFAVLMFPFPPSLNNIWRVGRKGYKSASYRRWIDEADFQAMQQKPWPRFNGQVDVSVKLGRPDRRRRDIDNVGAKAILDRLTAYQIIEDDSLVQRLSMEWADNVTGAQVEIMSCEEEAA